MLRLGSVELAAGAGAARFATDHLDGVELERLVVTAAGGDPVGEGLLHGTPNLFERIAARSGAEIQGVPLTLRGRGLTPRPDPDLEGLVALGERLLFEETFDGNGRTCGTCHPAENDFTLDADFIARLPETDPLFVAEREPALDASRNGGLVFENPTLMRRFGLIVVNIDGFEDPAERFVMRGVQHLLGLGRTVVPAPNLDQPLTQLLGWSGDGSTGSGSLREFTEGAVRQHFPLTMNRTFGEDFRFPSPLENNALEAFMLSLGRNEDADLTLPLLDDGAEAGRLLFQGLPSCNFCHLNGGSNSNFAGIGIGDFLQNTGVELLTQVRPDGSGERRPVDGGFGTNPEGDFNSLVANPDGSYGEHTFNSQSVIEAASTLPAFHSNLTANPASGLEATIEGAIRFYTTPEFEAEAGFPIDLTEAEIRDLGRFLRVLSALDDLDTIDRYGRRGAAAFASVDTPRRVGNRLMRLAAIECADAISVLEPVGLHLAAVESLRDAAAAFASATSGTNAQRRARIASGLEAIDRARADIR